jgi:hypothetical protein
MTPMSADEKPVRTRYGSNGNEWLGLILRSTDRTVLSSAFIGVICGQ